MNIKDLIVSAERIEDGKRVVGFVCGCSCCSEPYEDDKTDKNRPQGLLTHINMMYGNVKVYTDTLEKYVDNK